MTEEHAIERFEQYLNAYLSSASISVDSPQSPDGVFWLDVTDGDRQLTLFWRARFGFGVFTSDEGYGDKPDERYEDPRKAALRVFQLLEKPTGTENTLWLREVRALVGIQQVELANQLHVNQAAISRLENRDNLKIGSLIAYFEALGGQVDIRVRFSDFDVPVTKPHAQIGDDL
jgi:hypothetical protein